MNPLQLRTGRTRQPFILALVVSALPMGCGQNPAPDRTMASRTSLPLLPVSFDGGTGRGNGTTRDLTATSLEIRALRAAGVPADDPAIRRATAFLASCQRIGDPPARSDEGTPRDWGGFASTPIEKGHEIRPFDENRGRAFGAATCMGLSGLLAGGVPRDDPRIRAALGWLGRHYTLDAQPGMNRPREGLYAFYYEFAIAMNALGQEEIRDERGVSHDWRAKL